MKKYTYLLLKKNSRIAYPVEDHLESVDFISSGFEVHLLKLWSLSAMGIFCYLILIGPQRDVFFARSVSSLHWTRYILNQTPSILSTYSCRVLRMKCWINFIWFNNLLRKIIQKLTRFQEIGIEKTKQKTCSFSFSFKLCFCESKKSSNRTSLLSR